MTSRRASQWDTRVGNPTHQVDHGLGERGEADCALLLVDKEVGVLRDDLALAAVGERGREAGEG